MFYQRLQLCFFHFFPTLFRCRHALHCAKAMILAAQAPAISPHSFLFRNRSVDGRFSSAIRANHCFFLLLRPTPALRAVVGFGAAVLLRSVLTPRCFAPFFRPTPSPSVARRLRRCAAPLGRAHGSVLCTLLCGPPRFALWASRLRSGKAAVLNARFALLNLLCGPPQPFGLSWASGLRYCFAVSSPLGASHPFFGLPPALRRVAGFAAALPRLTSESACVFRSQFSAEPSRRFSAFGV